MTDLTLAESRTLARHEAVIIAGQKHFVAVGNALAAIRDAKLYRADYATFPDYCRDRWGFNKSRAYQFIEAAAVVSELPSTIVDAVKTESQARALKDAPVEQRAEVLQAAAEESPSGKPTAKKIAQAAARLNPGPASDYDDIDFGPPGPPTPAKAREPDPFDAMYYDDDAEREDDANIAPARQEPNIIGARKEEFRDWWQAVLTDPPHVAAYLRTFISDETKE